MKWSVRQVTPGCIAWAAVLAIFLLSPDIEFLSTGIGKRSTISYKDLFFTYKKVLVTKWKTKHIVQIVTNIDHYIFKAARPSALDSAVHEYFTNTIDRALVALDMESSDNGSETAADITGPGTPTAAALERHVNALASESISQPILSTQRRHTTEAPIVDNVATNNGTAADLEDAAAATPQADVVGAAVISSSGEPSSDTLSPSTRPSNPPSHHPSNPLSLMSLLPINLDQQAVYRLCHPHQPLYFRVSPAAQATGGQLPAVPGPQDVHPTAYASAVVPPPGLTGPPLLLQLTSTRPPIFRPQSSSSNMAIPFPTTTFRPPSSPPLPMMSLIFPGKQLKHGHTLSDYNIQTALVVMQLMLSPMTSKPRYRVTISWSPSLVEHIAIDIIAMAIFTRPNRYR
ncbi:hypothetical protein EV702DRAFT_1190955 [Suillus placidus]|uniref:Ubiquitin-like domain-containing protein n=1 Tax=Suillus placidus TaxID=48579 RepID=A0A9P7A7J6_9AGAM|nr:hypothetical protein EV702DRAFT_1190955 [Suillus placidus]